MAQSQNETERAKKEKQLGQLQKIKAAAESLKTELAVTKNQQETLTLIASVAKGLYEELDKLAKKSPVDEASDLLVEQVNDVIREAKALTPNDPFMKKYKEFVPAGDNPQHRDAIVVLRQTRQALDRFQSALAERRGALEIRYSDACGIRVALQLSIQGIYPSHDNIRYNHETVSRRWLTGGVDPSFRFDELDRTDIGDYFSSK